MLEEARDSFTVVFGNCVGDEDAVKRLRVTSEPTRDQPVEVSCHLYLRAELAHQLVVDGLGFDAQPLGDEWDGALTESAEESLTSPHLFEDLHDLINASAHDTVRWVWLRTTAVGAAA